MIKVSCYIDGFNIYHAIDGANRASRGKLNHLKWVDLRALMGQFTDPKEHEIVAVKFFTAYPTWRPDSEARHREYVKALNHFGTTEILGKFKRKDAYCKLRKNTYQAREEKESDVNIAMHLVSDAHDGLFDEAFLVTNDSDLLGPVRMVRAKFPAKKIKILAPPYRSHSKELWETATHRSKILEQHLKACLMPESVKDANGVDIFVRPKEYEPPEKK